MENVPDFWMPWNEFPRFCDVRRLCYVVYYKTVRRPIAKASVIL